MTAADLATALIRFSILLIMVVVQAGFTLASHGLILYLTHILYHAPAPHGCSET